MAKFNLDSYEPVDARLGRYWFDHPAPQGRVRTEVLQWPLPPSDICVVRARVYVDDVIIGEGHAAETPGEGMVNQTSWLENCETSAVGRALANAGYSPAKGERASREEMAAASESRARMDVLRDGCKAIVEGLDAEGAELWKAWKRDHPRWSRTESGFISARSFLYELAPDHAGEPFDTDQAGTAGGDVGAGDPDGPLQVESPAPPQEVNA